MRPAAGGHAAVPAAVPGQRVILTIQAVSLFTVVAFHQRVRVGVLGVASVQVALTPVSRFELQRLLRCKFPAQLAVDIFVFDAFTSGGQRIGIAAGTQRLMPFVDIPCVGLGFIQIAVQAEADAVAQRAGQAEVSSFGGTFFFVLRRIQIRIPCAMPLVAAAFGDDIHHAARCAVAVTRRRRAAQNFNTLNHLRWYPGGIAAGIALAAPAQTHGVAAAHRFAVNQDQGVFRAHAANINLAIVTALAAGGVAGQVNTRHGANDFGQIAGGRVLANFFGGNGRHARRLEILLGGGHHHGVFGRNGLCLFAISRGGGVGSQSRHCRAIDPQID